MGAYFFLAFDFLVDLFLVAFFAFFAVVVFFFLPLNAEAQLSEYCLVEPDRRIVTFVGSC